MWRNLLKFLLITQEVSNKTRQEQGLKILGKGASKARRFNPYNPLSYIAIVIILIVAILMFGFVGVWNEIDLSNPFKWN